MPQYVTIKEATETVGVSRATLYRWIKLGYLTKFRTPGFDRRTHIDLDELHELRRNPPREAVR